VIDLVYAVSTAQVDEDNGRKGVWMEKYMSKVPGGRHPIKTEWMPVQ
jgi:hypothetical protein